MKRFTALMLLTSALAAVAAGAQEPARGKPDEPPGAKKKDVPGSEKEPGVKKEAPDPDGEKDKKGGEGDDEKKAKELVARIGKGMQQSEKRLSEKDPRDTTQQ